MRKNSVSCEYCWPTQHTSHVLLHIDYYAQIYADTVMFFVNFFKLNTVFNDHLLETWGLEFLSFLQILQFTDVVDEKRLTNRSLIFLREAQKRGLQVQIAQLFGHYLNEWRLIHKGRKYYYQEIPLL